MLTDIASRIDALSSAQRELLARELRSRLTTAGSGAPHYSRLVAYVVHGGASSTSPDAFRAYLRELLPDYMVPSSFVRVNEIVRMPNGKVDRETLARIAIEASSVSLNHKNDSLHHDPLERVIADIWQRLLGVHEIRPDDDFFELGGHSLLGASLMMEVQSGTGIELPMSVLFETSTFRGLVDRVREGSGEQAFEYLLPLREGGSLAPLFCVHAPARTIAEHLDPDRPVYNFAHTLDAEDRTDQSVEAIADKYMVELVRVAPRGPYRLCGFSVGGMIAQELAQRLLAKGEEVSLLALADPPPVAEQSFLHYRLQHLSSRFRGRATLVGKLTFLLTEPFAILKRRLASQRVSLSRRAYEATGRPMTHDNLAAYNMAQYIRVGAAYRLRPYPGQSVLFLPEHEPGMANWLSRQWKCILPGVGAIYQIEGAKTHSEMFQPPHVGKLAELLGRHVEPGAQSGDRAPEGVTVQATSNNNEAPIAANEA